MRSELKHLYSRCETLGSVPSAVSLPSNPPVTTGREQPAEDGNLNKEACTGHGSQEVRAIGANR